MSTKNNTFAATPMLKRTYEKYRDYLEIFSLVFNEVEYNRVAQHIAKYELPWDFGIYTERLGAQMMHLGYVPFGALYSPDGKLVKTGLRPWELRRFLETLI